METEQTTTKSSAERVEERVSLSEFGSVPHSD